MSFAWKGFHSFGGGFSPSFGPSLTGGVTPIGAWDASTSTLAQLAALVTATRTSLATMFDSTGKLTYAPNNLLKYSNTFSNPIWVKASGGTGSAPVVTPNNATGPDGTANAASTVAFNTGAGTSSSDQSILSYTGGAASVGVSYLGAVYVKGSAGAKIQVRQNGAVAYSLFTLTGGWDWLYTKETSTVTTNAVEIGIRQGVNGTINSSITVQIAYAALSAVTYETSPRPGDQVITTASAYYGPRIDYDPNTLAVKGLLIEEARTNLYRQSDDLTNAVTVVSALSRTTDGTLAPNGVSLMAKMTANVGSAAHEFYQNLGVVSGTVYSASVFVKKGNHRYVFIAYEVASGTNGVLALFDLDAPTAPTQTFAVGGGALVTAGIINEGGGIYRIYVVGSVTGAGTAGYLVAGFVGSSTVGTTTVEPTYLAAGTEYGYFFGGQLEAGSFATSYIPTAAASVTRAADVVQFTGAALTALQGSAATFIGQTIGLPFNPAANSALVAATAGNAIIAYVTNSNAVGVAAAATYNGAAALTVGTPNYTTAMRIGSAFSGSGRSLVVNGGSVATDANAIGSRPAVYLGGTGASLYLNGWMQSFAIYNQRLPDATLQSKSVVNYA